MISRFSSLLNTDEIEIRFVSIQTQRTFEFVVQMVAVSKRSNVLVEVNTKHSSRSQIFIASFFLRHQCGMIHDELLQPNETIMGDAIGIF